VWLFVPSGTIPSIRAQSPAIEAAIEVIGETVVAIRGRVSASPAESVPEPDEQADKESMRAAARITDLVSVMAPMLMLISLIASYSQLQVSCE
jgi:hypothetical protein